MRFSRWTLRRRLIAIMVLLVAATSVVIGLVTFLVVRDSITSQANLQLQSRAQFVSRDGFDGGPGGGQGVYFEAGTIVAGFASSLQAGEYCTESATTCSKNLTTEQLKVLKAVQVGAVTEVDVPAYGEYRVTAVPGFTNAGRTTWVVGVPQAQLNRQVAAVLIALIISVVLAIVLAGLIGAWVIGRALRPLRRVAGVASTVASLPLERGDVELPERVPAEDTNPHTEVGQVGAALNNLLDSVETALAVRQASEAKVRHFVADASHELRTPLASIRGYAELTRRYGGDLTEDVQHNIGRIESEAKRMTRLVEDLLLLARLDAERELDTTDVDLSRLLVDVVSDAHAAGRDHEWEFEMPDTPVLVRGDEAKLQQVFTNLLANARVHTPAGTRVVVDLKPAVDGHVLVQVRDDGPGIPEALRPQLFGRFVRGDSSRNRNTGSTGLGLSIVSAVVQAHHGTVSVASEPGATVFTVQLPVHHPAAAAPREPVPA